MSQFTAVFFQLFRGLGHNTKRHNYVQPNGQDVCVFVNELHTYNLCLGMSRTF